MSDLKKAKGVLPSVICASDDTDERAYAAIAIAFNGRDISPMLRNGVLHHSNRLASVIDWINQMSCFTIPNDEKAFVQYLLDYYVIAIEFVEGEAYIDQDCVDDIRKKK